MNPRSPRVSVIVPACNVARYIGHTLESLTRQTWKDFEVLVVDDASSDETPEIVERMAEPRIRLIRHAANLGLSAARNTGIAHARGEYLALLDADDLAEPERLAAQVAALDADPGLMMVGSHVAVIDETGRKTGMVWKRQTDPSLAAMQLLFRNTFSAVVMFRRGAIPEGGYRSLPMAEDYDFNVRVAARGKVANLDRVLTRVRVRKGGLTQTRQAAMETCVREIMRQQIRTLGIEPSERELAINRHVGAYTLPSSEELLHEVENWLIRLCIANCETGRFPDGPFKKMLSMEWYQVCKFASPLGLQAVRTWRASPLRKYWQPACAEGSRFVAKCLLRHERRGGDIPALA